LFCFQGLKQVCEAGLAAQLNHENCIELLSLAHTHQGGAHLKRVTLSFIKEKSHEIFFGGFFVVCMENKPA
jgi:hypothetical protein